MLNLKDISDRIENTQLITSGDLDFLKEYSEKTPYCQLYSILYLKGLSLNEDLQFDQELSTHSYRITDRTQLYKLIQDKDLIAKDEESLESTEITIAAVDDSTPTPKNIEEEPIKEGIVNEQPDLEIESTIIAPEEVIDNTQTDTEDKTLDNVEKSILEHAFTANYALPELNEEEKIALEQKNNSSEKSTEIKPEIEVEKEEVEINIDTKQSFNSWLHSNRSYTESSNNDKDAILSIVEEKEESDDSTELFGKAEKPKKEFFSPTQKGKESLQEDQLPVSETLAKIYALQGNFP